MIKIKLTSILIILFFLYSFIWNIIRFIYFIKCLKNAECSNADCRNKNYCSKYDSKLTEADVKELLKLLEKYNSE